MIHRADYHAILLETAISLGAEIRLNATVGEVLFENTQVILDGGENVTGDVIIGADGVIIRLINTSRGPSSNIFAGLWSTTRSAILGRPSLPIETGDLAYRATFSRAQLEGLADLKISELCAKPAVTAWFGPKNHAVFYPIRGATEFNLVLLQPDDLPGGVRTEQGDLDEVQYGYREWDET